MRDASKLGEVFGSGMADAVVPDSRAKAAPAKKKTPAKKKAPVKRKTPARNKKAVKRKAATGAPKRVASAPKRKHKSR